MSALDEATAAAMREAGYDTEKYTLGDSSVDVTPPAATPLPSPHDDNASPFFSRTDELWAMGHGVAPKRTRVEGPEEAGLPDDIRDLGYSRRQLDYAIRQEPDPAKQIEMYAAMHDFRRMAEVASTSTALSEEKIEQLAVTLNMPPELAEMMAKEYPDELERQKWFAQVVSVAGTDSPFIARYKGDPNYAALRRGKEMVVADIQAAVTNAYSSKWDIILGWLGNSTRSIATKTFVGIPAGLSQEARDLRERPWKPQAEMAIPDGMEQSDPAGYIAALGLNQQIRDKNAMMEELLNDSDTQSQSAAISGFLADVDDWLQENYHDASTANYSGELRTGSWWMDNLVRVPVEGLPSLVASGLETLALGPAAPLVHFGLLAKTDSYREMQEAGVDPVTASWLSTARGLFEGYTEKLSMENMFSGPGFRDLFRSLAGSSVSPRAVAARILGHGVKSGIGEAVEEGLQGVGEAITTPLGKAISLGDPYANVFSALLDAKEDIGWSMYGGLTLGFLGGGFFGNTRRELADMRAYNSFQKALAPLTSAGDAAVSNGLTVTEARQDIRYMAHAEVAKGNGGMGTTVYADPGDVETYLQGKPREDAEKTLAAIGVTSEAFQQAKADHTDIEVPLENVAVQEGGADPHLTRLFRPTPNMATAAAIAQKTKEAASVFDLARTLRKTIDADTDGKTVPTAIQTMRQDLRTNLNYTAEQADFAASLAWAWGKTQADKRGVDVEGFLAGINIRAAMDSWIKQHPEWLAGVRARTDSDAAETETSYDPEHDAPAGIDPAMGEREVVVPEQPGDGGAGISGPEPRRAATDVAPGGGEAGGHDVGTPAPAPQPALFSPPPRPVRPGEYADKLTGLPFTMETTTTAGVRTDPGALQFKREADPETGVKRGEEIPGDVNPAALGTMVLYEDVDGDRFVVSGHHRLDLLRRKGEEAEVRAVVLKEADGWTTSQARVYGAALNIQEGGGDVDDYAAFFREAKIDRNQAENEGLFRRENARTGYAIGALGSDNVFYGFLNEELSAKRAAAIATAAPGDHAVQDMMIDRNIPTMELETFAGYVQKMRNSGALNLDGVQLSLFSTADDSAMLAAMERESKAAAKEAGVLDKKASSLESLLRAEKTLTVEELRKHGARAGDREGLRQEAAALRAEADRWRHFFHHPDILAQVQERAGTPVEPERYAQDAHEDANKDLMDMDAAAAAKRSAPGGSAFVTSPKGGPDFAIISQEKADRLGLKPLPIRMEPGNERWGANHLKNHLPEIQAVGFADIEHFVEFVAENFEYAKDFDGLVNLVAVGNDKAHLLVTKLIEKDGFYSIITGRPNSRRKAIRGWKPWAQVPTAAPDSGNQASPLRPSGPMARAEGLGGTENQGPSSIDSIPSSDGVVNQSGSPKQTFEHRSSGEKRGEVQLYRADAQHRQAAVIRVMKGGDMSTVLHELAHIFLADMRDYVNSGTADIDTVRDYGILLRAAGDMTVTDNVEQVSRWFEEYLREGRAPSVELVKPFGLFSKWLNRVYPNVRDYVGAEMDPETRGVFDRWLASEREIAEAEHYYGGLRSASFLNLIDDDEKRRELEEQLARNRQRVLNRHAGEMAKAWTSANADRAALAEEAKREVEAAPVYRAIAAAKAGGLDRAAAERAVGRPTVLKILDTHGDIFTRRGAPIDLVKELRKTGYSEADPVGVFLTELSGAVPVVEAVRKEGSHGRRKRYYIALEAIAKAGGVDMDSLPAIDFDTLAGLENHPRLFGPDARDNLDRIAVNSGFDTPSAMLDAMAKAPAIEAATMQLTERKVRAKAKEARAWAEESLTEVVDHTPPAVQSSLHNPDEDALADSIELQRQALRQALDSRERRRSAYVERRAMEDGAKQTLYSLPLREAMDYNNHAKAERYWSEKAAEAMARGDKAGALAALDKQQKLHALSTQAFRIRRDFADFMRRYGIRMAQSELATVKDAYRDAVRDLLVWSGVVVDKSGRFAPENADPDRLTLPDEYRDGYDKGAPGEGVDDFDPSLEAFAPSARTLIPDWILNKKLPRSFTGNILDLTPAHMDDIDASVKTLIKYGREELTALRDADNRRVADLRDKLMAVMETLPDKRQLDTDKRWDRLQSSFEGYLFGNMSIDTLAAEIDGFSMHQGKGLGLMQRLVDAIRIGEVEQMRLLDQFRIATEQDIQTLDAFVARLERDLGKFFNQEGVPSPAELTDGVSPATEWTPDRVLAMMFNAGNRGNYHALKEGFGFTDAQLDKMFSLATEKEWLAVQHIAHEMGGLFDLLDDVHYRMTNRHLERVRPEPFGVMTADGKLLNLDGWYYPLVFDPRLSDRAARNNEAAEYRAVMGAIFNPQKLRDGFTHKRVVDEDGNPVVTYPPLLNTRVIIDHMTTATRWATLAEPLMDFRRITMDPDFRKLFLKKLGAERYRDLRMWTNRMARPDKGSNESWNRLMSTFRNASTVASLGLNIRSAIRQLSSAGLAADEMSKASGNTANGWWYLWRGTRKMGMRGSFSRLLSPLGFTSVATEEMFRLSPEAKHRAENVSKEIREALDRWRPNQTRLGRQWSRVKDHLFHFTIATDHIVSGAAFWGSIEQFTSGNAGVDVSGMTRKEMMDKAVQYANRVVRTQQSPYGADYTRLQSDKGPISLFTQFMGGLTPYLNSSYVNIQLARRLGWKGAKPLATHLVNAYILPSVVLTMLTREAWKMLTGDDDDEDGDLAWDVAEEISGQVFGALPGVRDMTRFGLRGIRKGMLDERDLMPPSLQYPARISKRLFSAGGELLDGDAYAAGKDVGMAAAEILGVAAPIRQTKPVVQSLGFLEGE